MNLYINQFQLNKHFFSQIKNNNEEKKKYTSKIYLQDFFSINEAIICEKIKKIPYFKNYYIILDDYEYIKVGDLREKGIGNINYNLENNYLLFQYENNKCKKFNDFFYQIRSPKIFISNLLISISYLLNSLIMLNEKVCFFNISSDNIVFNYECGEKPFLINFRKSLNIAKLNDNYIINIIENTYDYTYKPLEVQLLFYIIHNNLNTISSSLIEEICEVYIHNLHILQYFSQSYQEQMKIVSRNSLKKYINKSKKYIIDDIIERYSTWDCYSISILYLHIFCNVIRVFNLKDTFLNKVIIPLVKNISPESTKRESLKETLIYIEKLYDENLDWSFVNKISNKKMESLFKNLFQ